MPIIKINNKNVLLVHIPKTGGRTVLNYFRNFGKVCLFKGERRHDLLPCSPQHFHAEYLDFLFDGFCDYEFCIVRNPLDRIISEYKHRLRQAEKFNWYIPSFSDWLKITFEICKGDPYYYDNHIRPQQHFIRKNTKIFEFESGLNAIIKELSIDLEIPYKEPLIQNIGGGDATTIDIISEDLELIHSFYKLDFDLLGYPSNLEIDKFKHSNL